MSTKEKIKKADFSAFYLFFHSFYFFIGNSMRVSALYCENPSFLACRLSAMGILMPRNKNVFKIAPIHKYHADAKRYVSAITIKESVLFSFSFILFLLGRLLQYIILPYFSQ